jgi:hypothetical protein
MKYLIAFSPILGGIGYIALIGYIVANYVV